MGVVASRVLCPLPLRCGLLEYHFCVFILSPVLITMARIKQERAHACRRNKKLKSFFPINKPQKSEFLLVGMERETGRHLNAVFANPITISEIFPKLTSPLDFTYLIALGRPCFNTSFDFTSAFSHLYL